MKKIKIFLASSIKEFADERMSLKNFVRQIGNVLVDYDVFVRMFICEFADNSVADGRKQDDFSREIDDSDIFFILTGVRLGDYTLEEYHYAMDVFKRRGDGVILACFKVCEAVEQSAKSFSEILSPDAERSDFTNAAGLKAALAMVIDKMISGTVSIEVKDGKALLAGKEIKL